MSKTPDSNADSVNEEGQSCAEYDRFDAQDDEVLSLSACDSNEKDVSITQALWAETGRDRANGSRQVETG
jgi:hypothetical protein